MKKAHYLDRLIGQTSQEDPTVRPRMVMVAETLNEWLVRPPLNAGAHPEMDIDDIGAQISNTLDTLRAPTDARNQRISKAGVLAAEFMDALLQLLGQLNAASIPSTGVTAGSPQQFFRDFAHFADDLPTDGRVVAYLSIAGTWNNPPNPYAFLRTIVGASVAGDSRLSWLLSTLLGTKMLIGRYGKDRRVSRCSGPLHLIVRLSDSVTNSWKVSPVSWPSS